MTATAKILKESMLRVHAGWGPNSKMPQIYLHYFGNESSESLLEAYGILPKGQKIDQLKPKLTGRSCTTAGTQLHCFL
jgi:integrase/recombinase XerD